MKNAPKPETLPLTDWYRRIADLPLNRFIDVLVNENYQALTIHGRPTEGDLLRAWGAIQQEYADAVGDAEYKNLFRLMREIAELEARLEMVRIAVEQIPGAAMLAADGHHIAKAVLQMYTDNLAKLLLDNKLDFTNPDTREKNLQRATNRAKGWRITLDVKAVNYKLAQEKLSGNGKKPTLEYFQNLLIDISMATKIHITDNITVFQFVTWLKKLSEKK